MLPVRWLLPAPDPAAAECAKALSQALQTPICLAQVLAQRGYSEPAVAQAFLNPKPALLGDPFDLPDMETAVARILLAVDRGERIVLYGDYDVDGVTSLAILAELLTAYGAKPACFLPMRVFDPGAWLQYIATMRAFTAVIERCPDTGLYIGHFPCFPGAHSQGESLDELQRNLREVIKMLLGPDGIATECLSDGFSNPNWRQIMVHP